MTALVSRISPPLKSKSGGVYQKIEMITQPDKIWGYTYVCPEHFNFERWENVIAAPHGVWVTNISWKDEAKKIFDADSKIMFHNAKRNRAVSQLELKF